MACQVTDQFLHYCSAALSGGNTRCHILSVSIKEMFASSYYVHVFVCMCVCVMACQVTYIMSCNCRDYQNQLL